METLPANLTLLRYLSIAICLVWLWHVNKKLSANELSFTLGGVWSLALGLSLVILVFPKVLFSVSQFFGTEVAANFLFFVAILFLVSICFALTLKDAKQQKTIVTLSQELGLLREEVEQLKVRLSNADDRDAGTQ